MAIVNLWLRVQRFEVSGNSHGVVNSCCPMLPLREVSCSVEGDEKGYKYRSKVVDRVGYNYCWGVFVERAMMMVTMQGGGAARLGKKLWLGSRG